MTDEDETVAALAAEQRDADLSMRRHVFISYSSEDRTAADAVYGALEDSGLTCWIAPRDIVPGSEYATQLVSAIASARLFVLLLSAAANKSPHVRREVERATSLDVPILAVRIEDVAPSQSLEYYLASTQWLDAAGPLGDRVGDLVQAAHALLSSKEARPAEPSHEGVATRRARSGGRRVGYVQIGDDEVAYSMLGDGPVDILHIPGLLNHVESAADDPALANHYAQLASFSRLVAYDRRGTGMSSPMRAGQALTLEDRAAEALAVMDGLSIDHATVFATADGVCVGLFLAATQPDRVSALVLYGGTARVTSAPDYPEGLDADFVSDLMNAEFHRWGDETDPAAFALLVPSRYGDPAVAHSIARMERLAGTPRAARRFFDLFTSTDVRDILPSVQQPTLVMHCSGDLLVPVTQGRWLASRMPRAQYIELDGSDHFYFWDRPDDVLHHLQDFLATGPAPVWSDRVLATVLAAVPVADPAQEGGEGEARNRAMMNRFSESLQSSIASCGGQDLGDLGGVHGAVFDAPSRAILCARAVRHSSAGSGLSVRIGLHTGEVERRAHHLSGATIDAAVRIATVAPPDQILVSHLVTELVAGTGIGFRDAGEHRLDPDGVEAWRLSALEE